MEEDWNNPDSQSGEQKYFKKALSDFTFEVASGGAVRHLADRGYTVSEIVKMLDFPTPYDRVGDMVRKHFLDTGVLRLEEPAGMEKTERYEYVADYDEYGRKSFRKVVLEESREASFSWKELLFTEKSYGSLAGFLKQKCVENGPEYSYISCRFGLDRRRAPKQFEAMVQELKPSHREYILGIFQERKMMYHRLDLRMQEIVVQLYGGVGYEGLCYFLKTQEKIRLKKENQKL